MYTEVKCLLGNFKTKKYANSVHIVSYIVSGTKGTESFANKISSDP